jgi:hypothetical protein
MAPYSQNLTLYGLIKSFIINTATLMSIGDTYYTVMFWDSDNRRFVVSKRKKVGGVTISILSRIRRSIHRYQPAF